MGKSNPAQKFFTSDLASKAAAGMSDGIAIAIFIDDQSYTFTKIRGQNQLSPGAPKKPELSFWLTDNAMHNIIEAAQHESASLATIGISIFEGILTQNHENKIKFAIHANFLKLWTKGYFSVLKAGGPEVAKYLAQKGFQNFSQMKKLFKN